MTFSGGNVCLGGGGNSTLEKEELKDMLILLLCKEYHCIEI